LPGKRPGYLGRMVTVPLELEDLSSERSGLLLADEFVLGEPATRFEFVKSEVVSMVDLFRRERDEDEPPFALALAKLAVFLGFAIGCASLLVVGLGRAVVRAALGLVG
jgi:hypothetical protein